MSLLNARSEIENPPSVELSQILLESAVMVCIAALLVRWFF